jgi:DNA mismatch repair protein MSH2
MGDCRVCYLLLHSYIRYLAANSSCFTLFATHFHELTNLAERYPCVRNRHVLVHALPKEIVLLYKVQDGLCDQSFGIHVAETVKFPEQVIKVFQISSHF